jgi:hypothetical protein
MPLGSSRYCVLFYNSGPMTGSNHTFTSNGGGYGGYQELTMAAFSGTFGGTPDINTGNSGGGSGTVQPAATSQTPAHNNEVIVTVVNCNAAVSPTINESFNITDDINTMGMAYLVQTTAAAVNPTWSGAFTGAAAVIPSFQTPAVVHQPRRVLLDPLASPPGARPRLGRAGLPPRPTLTARGRDAPTAGNHFPYGARTYGSASPQTPSARIISGWHAQHSRGATSRSTEDPARCTSTVAHGSISRQPGRCSIPVAMSSTVSSTNFQCIARW